MEEMMELLHVVRESESQAFPVGMLAPLSTSRSIGYQADATPFPLRRYDEP
jgi:hypothetical protein